MTALPEYTLRISPKARRILVRLAPGKGVEVVLPRGTDPARAPGLAKRAVVEKQAWIERMAAQYQKQGLDLTPTLPEPPEAVHLRALDETWPVQITNGQGHGQERAGVLENAGLLVVRCGPDVDDVCRALCAWVQSRARAVLPARLRAMSRSIGLDGYERVSVRMQKTRWGSLSARGTVSLNAKLLFLPPDLADHALVHELCHLKHMNHGPGFRRELARHAPDWQRLERELGRAGPRWVPAWLDQG